MAPPRDSNPMTSAIPKIPRATTTSGTPSMRYRRPKSKRTCAAAGDGPIMPRSSPSRPASRPFRVSLPSRLPAKLTPNAVSMNSSGEPSASTSGRAMGIESVRPSAPMSPPMSDERNAALSARAAWPCLASWWPSITDVAEAADPGAPISTEVIVSEVCTTARAPVSTAAAAIASRR